MKIYVDGLILKEKLRHLLDEHKNFKSDLSLKELSDFLEKYQIDKPVEDRYDRSRKFIDWGNEKEGWPHEYLTLVLIDDLDDFTYVFDMPPVTEVNREQTIEGMATEIVKNILEANRPKNVQLYEVSTKDIHYEPDYMLADETVGPEDTEVECLNCIHENHWDQCGNCDRDLSDFKMKSCETCVGIKCACCIGYSRYEFNDESEEKNNAPGIPLVSLTIKDLANILNGNTLIINGVEVRFKEDN